jgi:RHS repeat-associated protein
MTDNNVLVGGDGFSGNFIGPNNTQVGCTYQNNVPGTWGTAAQVASANNLGTSNSNPSNPCAGANNNSGPPIVTGDPVNVATGNQYESETDITCALHTGINLTRYYNSQDTTSSPFGKGWHGTWHRGLTLNGTQVIVTRADGRQDTFTNNGSGVYTADADVTSTLVQITSNGALTGWQLTLADDSVETYLPGGQLASVTTRAGLTTALSYDNNANPIRITGPFGHVMSFAYDANGHVSQMVAPDGGVYKYAYDANNNLIAVTYPDGTRKQYLYENTAFPNALTGITDENGKRFATYTYDTQGRATSTQHAGGAELTTITYNSDGSSTVADANGNTRKYGFTTQFGVMKPTALSGAPDPTVGGSAFTYDANGFIASKTDYDGNVTTFTHDARGNETSRTEAAGTALARTTTTTWHPTFHLPTQIVEPTSRTTTFAYDKHGNLLTKTITSGQQTRTFTFTYNAAGQVLTSTDPRGAVTRYTYDAKGDVATVTDALGHVTSFTSYNGDGWLLRAVDPNGLVTTFTYDARSRLVQRTEGAETTVLGYDAAGNLTSVQKPDGSVISSFYDAAHRLIGTRDALGNSLSFALDGNDNRVQVGAFDAANNLVQKRAFAYDTVNRLAAEFGAQNQQTDYSYDPQGNLTHVTDPLDHQTNFGYDTLNRRVAATDAANGQTRFGYDALDRLTAEQDPKGLTTGYFYDALDNQTGIASPDTGNTVKTYDAAGNVLTSTDARGFKTTYTYDALNRVTQARYPDGAAFTYQYDQGANGIGHLTGMLDSTGTTQWTYDQHGRVTSKTQQTNNITLITRLAYDAAGRLSQLQYPSGKIINVHYDANGQVNGLSLGNAWLVSNVAYRPFGPVQSWTEGNNAAFFRAFDMDGRITSINMGGVATVTYTYDAANRIIGETETGQPGQAFGYDALDRLTGFANGAAQTSYTYDADGNRLALADSNPLNAVTYSFAANSNKLLSLTRKDKDDQHKNQPDKDDTLAFTYDATGNTLSDGTHVFTYDARGRMNSVVGDDDRNAHAFDNEKKEARHTTQYGVNGLGERTLKHSEHDEDSVEYVFDESGHILGEYDEHGRAIEETVYLGNLPVAVLKGHSDHDSDHDDKGTVFYVAPDNLGAPHIITDAGNRKVWTWTHAPFGNTEPVSEGLTYNLRFPGQIHDQESGLNYNAFRDYNPALGRYVQSDPLGLFAGVNTYGYVKQNPVTRIDPKGLWPEFLGVPLFPEKKEQAEKNLPSLLTKIAPNLTQDQANQLSKDIIDELGTADITTAQTLANIKNPNDLTTTQKQAIDSFLNRLPTADQNAADVLRQACGIQ